MGRKKMTDADKIMAKVEWVDRFQPNLFYNPQQLYCMVTGLNKVRFQAAFDELVSENLLCVNDDGLVKKAS